MTNSSIQPVWDENATDSNGAGSDRAEGAVGLASPDDGLNVGPDGRQCPKCSGLFPESDSWCSHCGYYPVLGQCIDVDEGQDHYTNGEYVGPVEQPKSVWQSIPAWAWQLAAGLFVLAGVTVTGALLTSEGSGTRKIWSLTQVGVGGVIFLGVHLRLAIRSLSQDKQLGILDIVASPLRIWIEAISDFPRSFRFVAIGSAGFSAAVLAHVILGVPYRDFVNLEHKPSRPKAGLPVGAVAKMAPDNGEDLTMEEALDAFANGAGVDELAQVAEGAAQDQEKDLITRELNCLVVGCVPQSEVTDRLRSLVVAVKMKEHWRVVGTVSEGLTPELDEQIRAQISTLRSDRPFVPCDYTAIWLKPEQWCQIEVKYADGETRPTSMKLLKLL